MTGDRLVPGDLVVSRRFHEEPQLLWSDPVLGSRCGRLFASEVCLVLSQKNTMILVMTPAASVGWTYVDMFYGIAHAPVHGK